MKPLDIYSQNPSFSIVSSLDNIEIMSSDLIVNLLWDILKGYIGDSVKWSWKNIL